MNEWHLRSAIHIRFKRPFIEIAKTWKWFYHYCIDPETPVGPWLPRFGKKKREKAKSEYLQGLIRYAENTIQSRPQQGLKRDI